jgi:uncharacterized membrane protein YeaQ/YmgE (transglycosylase-associated protein family)
MSFLAWIPLGLVAGFLWRKVINESGEGMILDIVLGIVGACLGGGLFSILGAHGVTAMNLYSLLVAVIGSVIFLIVCNAIGRAQQSRRWDDGAGQW